MMCMNQAGNMLYCIQTLNFGGQLINNIQKLQAAILHLGNVELVDAGDGESSKIANMAAAHLVARESVGREGENPPN